MKWNKKEGGRESGRLSAPLFTGKARVPYSERGMVAYVSFCLFFSSRIQGSPPMGAQNGLKGEIETSTNIYYSGLPCIAYYFTLILLYGVWYGPWMSLRNSAGPLQLAVLPVWLYNIRDVDTSGKVQYPVPGAQEPSIVPRDPACSHFTSLHTMTYQERFSRQNWGYKISC